MWRFRSLLTALALALTVGLAIPSTTGCRADAVADAAAITLRDDLRKLIISDRKPADLKPQTVSQTDLGNNRLERVRFTPETGFDATAAIYRPKLGERFPVVIVQHFLGGSKDHLALVPLLNGLANKGFLAVAIDGRFRGERQNGKSLDVAMLEALRTGKGRPFLVDTAYDITRLIDYLQTRPDVDGQRIGMTGMSEGGMITWLTAAMDDRIKVAVPIIGVSSLADSFMTPEGPESAAGLKLFDSFLKEYAKDLGEKEVTRKVLKTAWEKLVPGMLDKFDAPAVLPLIAPRPLLVLNHELDELFPVEGAKRVAAAARIRYEAANAADRFEFRVAPGLKHAAFNLAELNGMVSWMERWLKV